MNEEELKKNGVNISMIHEDFMIGTSDLEIVGVTEENWGRDFDNERWKFL